LEFLEVLDEQAAEAEGQFAEEGGEVEAVEGAGGVGVETGEEGED